MKNDQAHPLAPVERNFAWFGFRGLDQAQTDLLAVGIIIFIVVFTALCVPGCVGIEPLMPDH